MGVCGAPPSREWRELPSRWRLRPWAAHARRGTTKAWNRSLHRSCPRPPARGPRARRGARRAGRPHPSPGRHAPRVLGRHRRNRHRGVAAAARGPVGDQELELRDLPLPEAWPHHGYVTSESGIPTRSWPPSPARAGRSRRAQRPPRGRRWCARSIETTRPSRSARPRDARAIRALPARPSASRRVAPIGRRQALAHPGRRPSRDERLPDWRAEESVTDTLPWKARATSLPTIHLSRSFPRTRVGGACRMSSDSPSPPASACSSSGCSRAQVRADLRLIAGQGGAGGGAPAPGGGDGRRQRRGLGDRAGVRRQRRCGARGRHQQRAPGVVVPSASSRGEGARGPGAGRARLPASSGRSSRRSRRGWRLATADRRAHARCSRRRGAVTKAQLDTDEAQLKTSSADVGGARRRRSSARSCARRSPGKLGIRYGQPRPVPEPGHADHRARVDRTRCTSTSRCRSSDLPDVPVGGDARVALPGEHAGCTDRWTARSPAIEPTVDPATRARQAARQRARTRRTKLRPGMFVNVSVVLPSRAQRSSTVPADGDRARAPTATRSSSSRTEGRAGARSNDAATASRCKIARQQFVRLGEARGDFVAIVDGRKGRAGGGHGRRLQAAQRRRASSSTTTSSRRRSSTPHAGEPLSHEIHRHLHPPAGPGDRRQPGHHHRRAAGDPHAQRPPVSEARERHRHRAHAPTSAPTPIWCAASSPRRSSAPSPPPTASTTSSRRATRGSPPSTFA